MSKDVKIKLLQKMRLSLDGMSLKTYSQGDIVLVPEVTADSLCINSDPPVAELYDEAAETAKAKSENEDDKKNKGKGK